MTVWAWKKKARTPFRYVVALNVALLLEASRSDESWSHLKIDIWHRYATIDRWAFSETDREHDRIDGGQTWKKNAERKVCSDWAAE